MKGKVISIGLARVIFAIFFIGLGALLGKKWIDPEGEEKRFSGVEVTNAREEARYIFNESLNNDGRIENSVVWTLGRFVDLPFDLDEKLFGFQNVPSGLRVNVSRLGAYTVNFRLNGQISSRDKSASFIAKYIGDSFFSGKDQAFLSKEFRVNVGHWEEMLTIGLRDGIKLSKPFSVYSYKNKLYVGSSLNDEVTVINIDGIRSRSFEKTLLGGGSSFKSIRGDKKGSFALFSCSDPTELRDGEFNVVQTLSGKCQYGVFDDQDAAYYILSYLEKKLYRLNLISGDKYEYLMDTDANKIITTKDQFFLGKGFQLKARDKKTLDLKQVIDFDDDVQSLASDPVSGVIFVAVPRKVYILGFEAGKNVYRVLNFFSTSIDFALDMYFDPDSENLYLVNGERAQISVYRYIGH